MHSKINYHFNKLWKVCQMDSVWNNKLWIFCTRKTKKLDNSLNPFKISKLRYFLIEFWNCSIFLFAAIFSRRQFWLILVIILNWEADFHSFGSGWYLICANEQELGEKFHSDGTVSDSCFDEELITKITFCMNNNLIIYFDGSTMQLALL